MYKKLIQGNISDIILLKLLKLKFDLCGLYIGYRKSLCKLSNEGELI